MSRTTIAVRVPTRDRVTAAARAEHKTVDAFLARLLDAYEEQVFWAAMAATSAEDYQAAAREDGIWPGDYDYSPEAAVIRRDESRD
ncbi:MAG: hypothetical protein LBG60_15400 [Bifidobacteriaceae bacterium]|jgi:hypothetical protein|nr:hypothetical protein [Bifidobacteriaceae bacterium]